MNKKYPKQIFVSREETGTENEWLQVNKTVGETACIGKKKRIGHYVLKEVLTVESKVVVTTQKIQKA